MSKSIPKNLARRDRLLRILLAVVLAALWWRGILTGWVGISAMVLAGGLLLNAVMGRCGLYAAFGLSTCPLPPPSNPADTEPKQ